MPTPHNGSGKYSCGVLLDERSSEILVRLATQHGVRRAAGLPGLPSRSLLIRSVLRLADRYLMEDPRARQGLHDAVLDDAHGPIEQAQRNRVRADYYHAQRALWQARRDLQEAPEEKRERCQAEFERCQAAFEETQGFLPRAEAS